MLLPIFAPNENSYPAGLEAVTPHKFRKGQLSYKQHQALAKMKQYTDLNDLATKSVLGSEALERQLRPMIENLTTLRLALIRKEPQTEDDAAPVVSSKNGIELRPETGGQR